MNKLSTALLGAAAIAAAGGVGLLATVSAQPDVHEVHRSVTLDAEAKDVVPYLVDLEKFAKWSPWTERDPGEEYSYSDPPRGVNAWWRWKGNDVVGGGEVRVKAVSPSRVLLEASFKSPAEAGASLPFSLVENGESVTVDWGYEQPQDLRGKALGLFMDRDAQVGGELERGLEMLKRVVEDDARKRRTAAAAQGHTVKLRGTFVYKGEAVGVRRLLVRSESGDIVAARKLSGKSWEVPVPRSVGAVQIHAFVDRDRDGPTPGDPGAVSAMLPLAEGTPAEVVLRVTDDFDATVSGTP